MFSHHHHPLNAAVFHCRLNPNPNKSLQPITLNSPHRPLISPLRSHELPHTIVDESDIPSFSRRQNAISTAPLPQFDAGAKPSSDLHEKMILSHQKSILVEQSLSSRRIPRFPGSVDFPGTERLDPRRPDGGDDQLVIHRALEVRRSIAGETLKEALSAGKLRRNYSANLVAGMPDFVDRIVIGAAEMKGDSESSHLSFNARAKAYVRSSGVVALVKWLKHNHLTIHQIGKTISMCTIELEQVKQLCEWLKTIHVKAELLDMGSLCCTFLSYFLGSKAVYRACIKIEPIIKNQKDLFAKLIKRK